MNNAVTLLQWENLDDSELSAMKIVRFMGREIRPFVLTREALDTGRFSREAVPLGESLITSARTLSEICKNNRSVLGARELVRSLAKHVFVYGFRSNGEDGQILRELTLGGFVDVKAFGLSNAQFRVQPNSRDICRQFAGLGVGSADRERDLTFVEGTERNLCSSLITIGQEPFLVRFQDGERQMLLVACREIADLDASVPRNTSLLRFFSSLMPLMMFVAATSSNRYWHNDSPQACFIVDDPLLKKRYGFLDYQRLLELMETKRFCTSLAFIPWNFNRTEARVAKLFANYPHRYSICVHGCDHTGGEFGTKDYHLLRDKSQKSLERMKLHRKLSGLRFDDVMVFPQGIFSTAAMEALKSCSYLAAVNSTAYSVDSSRLPLRDLLQVAVTRFANFPLFVRRRPQDIADLACDLFLGKPALVVEHHGFFRKGYKALAETIKKLSALDERLEWSNLATICSHAHLQKVADNGEVNVRFFTNRFCLRNDSDVTRKYLLARRSMPTETINAVTVNEGQVPFRQDDGWVKMELSVGAGQIVGIKVGQKQTEPLPAVGDPDRAYEANVFIRRGLSEFRDNYLDRSRFVSKAASGMLGLLAPKRKRVRDRSKSTL